MAGRPRTAIGTYGAVNLRRRGSRALAETRIRDADGRIRHVRITARTVKSGGVVYEVRGCPTNGVSGSTRRPVGGRGGATDGRNTAGHESASRN